VKITILLILTILIYQAPVSAQNIIKNVAIKGKIKTIETIKHQTKKKKKNGLWEKP